MVFFRCTVGGSGKGNTVTVTCAEEFAGLTITLSKTGKTYTKTCPSTSPYTVTFYGVENGTYTVSCTVDGQTYSETVIVQDISCVLNYGFNWQTWVDTASQLDSSDYDSLDEVLEDEAALRELFLEHACVDYMASVTASNADLETIINDDYCAKWINLSDYALDYLYANEVIADLMDEADKYFYGEWVITDDTTTPPTWGAKGNVPVMTANTAPYGTAFASEKWPGENEPYVAFNNTVTGSWYSYYNTYGKIGYKFTNPVCVTKFKMWQNHGASATSDIGYGRADGKLQGSNDNGTTWVDIHSFTKDDLTENGITVSNSAYYLSYRIIFSSYNYKDGSYKADRVKELQFYGRELKVSVPTMTSNTAPYGEASASSVTSSSYQAWKAFDGVAYTNNSQDAWVANASDATPLIYYEFTHPVKIKMAVTQANQSSAFSVDLINGNGDGWNVVETITQGTIGATTITNNIDGGEALRWGFKKNSTNLGFFYIQFYGFDYSEKEFEEGTTKKWLYDHGVELETLTTDGITGATGSIKPIKEESQIYFPQLNAEANNGIATVSTIDITPYSLLRIKGGNIGFYTNNAFAICGFNDAKTSSSWQARLNIANLKEDSLDISAINQEKYFICISGYQTRRFTMTELWLE